MTRRILTILIGLLFNCSFGQTDRKGGLFVGNVVSDTMTLKRNDYREAFPSILTSKHKIEIRFIKIPSFDYTSYVILSYDKKWDANYYYFEPKQKTLQTKPIDNKINLDATFKRLVSDNIFSLPDQDSVETKKYTFYPDNNDLIGEGMAVCDGTVYYIEFKVGDNFRRYSYSNPMDYAKFYPLVHELQQFADIEKTLNKLTEK